MPSNPCSRRLSSMRPADGLTDPARRRSAPEGGGAEPPVRVLHVITRMILGGAQETVLASARMDRAGFPSAILTGPQTGTEGELLTQVRHEGLALHVERTLVRQISPAPDARAF